MALGDSEASVSPAMKHVVYTVQGLAMVSEIVEVSRSWYDHRLEHKERNGIEARLSTIASALFDYAQEQEGRFPSNKGDWRRALSGSPLLAGTSLEGFVYTFAGGLIGDDPSQVELGYIAFKTEQAVVYGDLKVRWRRADR